MAGEEVGLVGLAGTIITIMTVLGLALVGAGLWRNAAQRRVHEEWVRVEGTTAGAAWTVGDSAATAVRFRTQDGQDIVGTPRFWVDIGFYPTGRIVPVWYDPADPTRFESDVFWIQRHAGWLLIALGAVPLGIALTVWSARR